MSSISGISEVRLATGEIAYARLRGFVCETWAKGTPAPPLSQRQDMDILITRLPFAIGRSRHEDTDETVSYLKVPNDPKHWHVVDNGKVSKKHAVIFHKPGSKELRLRCYGRNGVDFDESHLEAEGEVILTSRSCLRAGPLYCYLLLPLTNPPAPNGAGGGGGGGGALPKAIKPRVTAVQYKMIIDTLFTNHFLALGGYFTLQDLLTLTRSEVKDIPLSDDDRILRQAFKKRLEKESSGYEEVPIKDVPNEILSCKPIHGTLKSSSAVQWFRRSSKISDIAGDEDGDDE
jgi:hypothetical protein